MSTKKTYEAPSICELGSLHEVTLDPFNKVGNSADIYTGLTQGQVIGSLVPAQ